MTELDLQLRDIIRTAERMLMVPRLCDARVLVGMARCAEHLTELAFIAGLPTRTPAEDKASQRYIAPFEDDQPNKDPAP